MAHLLGSTSLFLFALLLIFYQIQFGCTREFYSNNASCIESERKALYLFKKSLIDDSNRLSSWTREDCCAWEGIGCSKRTGHVVKLDLHSSTLYRHGMYSSNSLGGQLNPSLVNLKYLRYLDLSMNRFSGIQIPTFLGSLKDLRYLNLSHAGFEGEIPHHLGNLSSLRYLDLSQGPFPDLLTTKNFWWLAGLSSLEGLSLSGVNLNHSGDWSQIINMLPSLISLHLMECALSTINPYLSAHVNFTSLTSLDLSYNEFNSTIPPWLFNFTGLMELRLSNNYFHGPLLDNFEHLASLNYIDLNTNSINTSIPISLCNLSSLGYLDLSDNAFQGSIPSEIGHLGKLSKLDLSFNHLNGTLPCSLSQLTKLQELDLSYNSLTGVLSELHFAKLIELKFLSLSGNYLLASNVSSSWIPPFQLQRIDMTSIKIGPRFPAWLRTQKEIEVLYMSNASISDAIPNWFRISCSDIRVLDLSINNITGKPLEFRQTNSKYRWINLHSNRLEGSLQSFQPDIQLLDLSKNFLTGEIPLPDGNTTNMQTSYLQLNDNLLTGSIPKGLCRLETLIELDLSNNQLTGRVPLCLGNLRGLSLLKLANNSLFGEIPGSLGNLENLNYLHLNDNELVGKLPSSLQNLISLEVLDLGENELKDTIPGWIGEKLSNLKFLKLQSNNFHGEISCKLCQLSSLQVLNLANNNLTGTIPRCFNNFSMMIDDSSTGFTNVGLSSVTLSISMKGNNLEFSANLIYLKSISLSENNLVGEIPEEITVLVELQSLDLSRNNLSGRIPKRIGNLTKLESLDLSMNQLFGAIPQSLSAINTLSYLNLSYNKLSGRIPSGNQLQTLTDPSIYEGNSELCGKPLLKICPEDKSPIGNGKDGDHESGGEDNFSWFYAGLGPGFAVGLLGVLGTFHFNKSWRYAFFKFSVLRRNSH